MAKKALHFGRVDQMGLVVESLDRALPKFSDALGVRAWYRPVHKDNEAREMLYRGQQIKIDFDFVIGYCGSMQFELIVPGSERNIYVEHLEKHGEGFHHICFFVSDLDRKLAAYKELGAEPVQSGAVGGKSGAVTRYAYLDNTNTHGFMIEMSETRLFGIPTKPSPFIMKMGALTGDLIKV